MFRDSSLSYKIDYVIVMKSFPNPEGHTNCMSGSKDTVILLRKLILHIGGLALGRVCACSLHSRLVIRLKIDTKKNLDWDWSQLKNQKENFVGAGFLYLNFNNFS